MSRDDQHAAFPRLMGAPAYSRPRPPVDGAARPPDPDDQPLTYGRVLEDAEGEAVTDSPAPEGHAAGTPAEARPGGSPLGGIARRLRRTGG